MYDRRCSKEGDMARGLFFLNFFTIFHLESYNNNDKYKTYLLNALILSS